MASASAARSALAALRASVEQRRPSRARRLARVHASARFSSLSFILMSGSSSCPRASDVFEEDSALAARGGISSTPLSIAFRLSIMLNVMFHPKCKDFLSCCSFMSGLMSVKGLCLLQRARALSGNPCYPNVFNSV
ncbi:hypothetical protein K438DRAFT_1792058 [Mycena galopus ATCC 62051]|nr:hypothetical protein K438DRAFT_1792058 [Mycena galopus ATCC 62051]